MMEDIGSTEEQWDNKTPESMKDKRGSFLSMLCVLSWVSQAMAGSSALLLLSKGRADLEKQIDVLNKLVDQESTGISFFDSMIAESITIMEITIMNFTQIQLSNLLVIATGALGVYMMFKLKKVGFLIYIGYCIAELFVVYHFYGDITAMVGSMFISGLVSVVFIILYAVNLKRMTE